MRFVIHEIDETYHAPVIRLWEECGLTRPWNDPAKDLNFACANENSTVLAALFEGELAASVMTGHDGHRGWVYYLSVARCYRGKGLGRQMMRAAEDWLRAKGIWKLNLLVRTDNAGTAKFYEHLGYAKAEVSCYQKKL